MALVVVIGSADVGRRACSLLTEAGVETVHLGEPSDAELKAALTSAVSGIAVLLHDDISALRYCLAIEGLRPGIRLFVAMFDRTAREQVRSVVPNCVAVSPAMIATPSMVAAVVDPTALAVRRDRSSSSDRWIATTLIGEGDGIVNARTTTFTLSRRIRWAGRFGRLQGQLRPYDSGSAVLLGGAVGLLTVTAIDTFRAAQSQSVLQAFYEAARTTATIAPAVEPTGSVSLLWAAVAAILVMGFTAAFGAGIVHHLIAGRQAGLIGRRVVPKRGHVVIAGMGQVGVRLAQELRDLGVAVVGVEPDSNAIGIGIAKGAGIPVVKGDATARHILLRAGVGRALAVVCAASRDRDSIAVAVSCQAVAPHTDLVVRAGADDAIQQTRSLWHIGTVVDVNGLTAAYVVQSMLGAEPTVVAAYENSILCVTETAETTSASLHVVAPRRCDC